tara:strand:+ start:11972 stop:12733 length:762 start_codon:yes stop_codon:yes gene_type:complete
MATKQDVAKRNNTLLYEDETSIDAEGFEQADLMIPRISILQPLSPELNKQDAKYIKGAEAGAILHSVSKELVDGDKGITVVPIRYRRAYVEWRPDRKGGGPVRDHGNDASILEQCEFDSENFTHTTSEGNEIVTNGEYLIFIIDEDGEFEPALLAMSKSQLKKSRRWNSMIANLKIKKPNNGGFFTPAMFYSAYHLSTLPESNDKGHWFGWEIEMLHGNSGGILENYPNGEKMYLSARSYKSKEIKAAPEEAF